ncbi:MAG TPA: tRNA (adenosine(37)-N6)-threonylcarbamoyltransferase complex ATPase subunit type 1 TsaE [Bacteroidales bacterium]|nr:tRNA (adenosine(37)-N6)-threonylcarbamoyltransferase complex ATPase subunit type 1 TsaE [Bacteroidales bacterium]
MAEIYTCKSPDELPPIALNLISFHKDKRIFAFHGEMGAGKTTFIKTMCACLKVTDTVSSPTFAIVNEYFTENSGSIYHFDLYRIKSWTELLEIGYEDYFFSGNYCLLEWPEKIVNLLPEETVHVTIEVSADGSTRSITF